MRGLALFAGIGGLERGIGMCVPRYRTELAVEINQKCWPILRRASRLVVGDIHHLHIEPGEYDIASGGFPCQPFSTASRGRKVARDLWPEMRRIVREGTPTYVFAENVQSGPIRRACDDLAAIGYRCAAAPVSSAHVGAPDDRRRWWLLAHYHDATEPTLALHAEVAGIPAARTDRWEWDPPRSVLGVGDGFPAELDRSARLKLLGNAANPFQAAAAFRLLLGVLAEQAMEAT